MSEEIKKIQSQVVPVLKKHNVKKSSIFGSFARGESDENSDIDILVELEEGKTLLNLIDLEMDLEKALNKKIDLITYNSINPLLQESILGDEIKIYG